MAYRFGLFAVALLAALSAGVTRASADRMTFELVPFGDGEKCGARCPEVISAVGEIMSSTPREFLEFVKSHIKDERMRSIVFLHSPGGSVAASMRLGEMFRKTGVAAVVARLIRVGAGAEAGGIAVPAGRCFSACVYAFMGGRKRVVPPSSLLGIHRMSFDESERDVTTLDVRTWRKLGTPDFVRQLSNYAASMGVSREIIATAEQISPDDIHIVTPAELRRWRLAVEKF